MSSMIIHCSYQLSGRLLTECDQMLSYFNFPFVLHFTINTNIDNIELLFCLLLCRTIGKRQMLVLSVIQHHNVIIVLNGIQVKQV